jgi:hypothetical protein
LFISKELYVDGGIKVDGSSFFESMPGFFREVDRMNCCNDKLNFVQ